jgi:hypothetical protein
LYSTLPRITISADDISVLSKPRRASIYSSFLNLNISTDDEEILDDQQYDIVSSQTEMVTNLVVWNEYDPNNSNTLFTTFAQFLENLNDTNTSISVSYENKPKSKRDAELRFWPGELVLPHSFAKVNKMS